MSQKKHYHSAPIKKRQPPTRQRWTPRLGDTVVVIILVIIVTGMTVKDPRILPAIDEQTMLLAAAVAGECCRRRLAGD